MTYQEYLAKPEVLCPVCKFPMKRVPDTPAFKIKGEGAYNQAMSIPKKDLYLGGR